VNQTKVNRNNGVLDSPEFDTGPTPEQRAIEEIASATEPKRSYNDPSEQGIEARLRIAGRMDVLITRIEKHQVAKGLSDAQFCQRYAKYVGSAKTYVDRLRVRKFDEFGAKLTHWLHKLEAFVAELDGRSAMALFVPSMPLAKGLIAMYHRLQAQQTDRRCGVCLAITGCGKSISARHIVNEFPREAVYTRCNENWRDSKTQIARGIAEALGLGSKEPMGAANTLNKVIEHLKINPVTIFLDEAHEGGVLLMKLVKTLIDETSAKFILLAYPTSWNKMLAATDDARAEAQQLFGRTLKPVFADYANGIKREDIVTYLHQAAGLNGEAEEVASQILGMVRTNGNLRLLADAVEAAQIQADAIGGDTVTGALIVEHVKALCPARKEATL
jgi:hypothetical protein